jgi:hypothetical protein
MIRLRFARSADFSSDLIAWRESICMPFTPSHVECVSPDGKFWIGEVSPDGMQARPAGYDAATMLHEMFVDLPATQEQADAFYAAATASIGEPYDWEAILGFIEPGHHHEKFHAICSAKMTLLLRKVGWLPFALPVPAHCIDPRDLLLLIGGIIKLEF